MLHYLSSLQCVRRFVGEDTNCEKFSYVPFGAGNVTQSNLTEATQNSVTQIAFSHLDDLLEHKATNHGCNVLFLRGGEVLSSFNHSKPSCVVIHFIACLLSHTYDHCMRSK